MARLLNRAVAYQAILFVGLNVADAWLTREHLAIGNTEGNPLTMGYGSIPLLKGALAVAVVLVILLIAQRWKRLPGWLRVHLGSGESSDKVNVVRLLGIINVGMAMVVLWNAGWLLYFN